MCVCVFLCVKIWQYTDLFSYIFIDSAHNYLYYFVIEHQKMMQIFGTHYTYDDHAISSTIHTFNMPIYMAWNGKQIIIRTDVSRRTKRDRPNVRMNVNLRFLWQWWKWKQRFITIVFFFRLLLPLRCCYYYYYYFCCYCCCWIPTNLFERTVILAK